MSLTYLILTKMCVLLKFHIFLFIYFLKYIHCISWETAVKRFHQVICSTV